MPQNPLDNKLDKLKVDYENLFSSDVGKRVLNDLLLSCGVDRSCFSVDALEMARKVARQEVGQHIEFMATPTPEKKEHKVIDG
jgi:hypothetical protein